MSRVESVRVAAYRVPTDRPEADGTLAWDTTTVVVVEASADGVTGSGWTFAPAACATPGLRHQEWFHDHVRIAERLVEGAGAPVEGVLAVPTGPGHGLRFRTERAADLRVA